jgi:putative ABC transport system permease protein
MNDLRFAFRVLIKSPAFSLIAILTLALGIGANSAIFSVIDTVLLRPLPFKDPERLVMIWNRSGPEELAKDVNSYPDFADFRDQNHSLTSMAAFTRAGAVLNAPGESQELEGLAVSAAIFDVLGVKPMLGRGFTRDEDKPGAPWVMVISYNLWKSAFGGDPAIVGKQVNVSGRSNTILGVMPPGWKFPVEGERIDYLGPIEPAITTAVKQRGSHFLSIVGRLNPGVSLPQAEAELKIIAARLAKQYPDENTGRSVWLDSLHDDIVGDVRPALLILLGAVALVLCIACANVANLLLARAAARSREIAIRTALGASRSRLVRQLLVESFVLAFLGGCAGLLLAWWGVDLLRAFGPDDLPRLNEIAVNSTVCSFTLAVALLSTLVFGLIPAWQIARPQISEALQQGAKGSSSGVHSVRLRTGLVVAQVAVSLLLLAGAGLLIKSFFNLRSTKTGFDSARLLTMDLVLPKVKYPEADQQIRAFAQLLPKIAALPGVQSAGGVNPLPFSGNSRGSTFTIASAPPLAPGNHPAASHLTTAPGYFATMQIPVLAGRAFDERDTEKARQVIIVNEAFARKYFHSANPLNEKVIIDSEEPNPPALDVIGVVANSKHDSLSAEPEPEFYVPFAQAPERRLVIVLRTATPTLSGLDASVRQAVHAFDKDIFVPAFKPMTQLLGAQLARPRFNMMLLAIFAGVAMTLAAIGLYGVLAFGVAQRTREIGIRMALGAQRGDMLRMILRQSLMLVSIGIVVGIAAALGATRLLRSLLYGVQTNDFVTYLIGVVVLGAAALLAAYLPARRAMKVDPMEALRYE